MVYGASDFIPFYTLPAIVEPSPGTSPPELSPSFAELTFV